MIILSLRSDKPESELALYDDSKLIDSVTWEAHRQLAETIHHKIKDLLDAQRKDWSDIEGIIIYKGPGSFTGLRIGMSVANALASSLQIPIVSTSGDNWCDEALRKIIDGTNQKIATPEEGSEPHITQQRK
jgi:tRNA threonylcarbamoyl adenosine modification protein YeaZ